MSNEFFEAAARYYGVAETNMRVVEVYTQDDRLHLTLRVELRDEDLMGILKQMEAVPKPVPGIPFDYGDEPTPTREQLREQYNALSKQERSRYGSFHNYMVSTGLELHPLEAEKVELPAHVYLSPAEATPQQKAMAIGRDEKGNYAVAVEDLTPYQCSQLIDASESKGDSKAADELRVAYVQRTMDVHLADGAGESLNPAAAADNMRADYVRRTMGAHARLNGADGKPTSNADDFGGVPG